MTAAILVYNGGAPTWRFHTGLCKFLRNISTNTLSLGKRIGLKVGEVSYLFFPLDGFRFIYFLLVTVKTIN